MYISQIGQVFKSEIHEGFFKDYFKSNLEFIHKYVKKGESFQNLIANTNYLIQSKEDFFNNFELWENENGIGTLGKTKEVELISINEIEVITINSKEPIFVGDILIGGIAGQVVYSQGVFNSFLGYWQIDCKLGILTPVLNFGIENIDKYNSSVLDSLKQVKTSIDKLATEINKLSGKAVSEVTGQATGASVNWNLAITTLVNAINKIGTDFQNAINKNEEFLI